MTNLVAAKVAHPIAANESSKPIGPCILNRILSAARPITGNRQYPNTEQVLLASRPTGCSRFSIPYIP